ncbi:MAG: YdcF family protein [Alphaproteobacteria bacterium]|nr:YdcF family protein [Alphaproteobacteria bacterium]
MYFISLVPTSQTDTGKEVTDAAVVLTGGKKRIQEGINILKNKKTKKLLITGVHKKTRDKDLIVLYGNLDDLSSDRVSIGREAESTLGNAIEAKKWVEENNIRTIRLVTANYHMTRSVMEFRHAIPDVKIIEHPVFPKAFKITKLWNHPGSVYLLFKEYNKILFLIYDQRVVI